MRVSDGAGSTDTLDLTVRVTHVNEVPVMTGPVTVEHEENGSDVVAAHTAIDPAGPEVSWSLASAAGFTIGVAGVLTFNAPLDHELRTDADVDNMYRVTVQATDAKETVGTLEVVVTVADVDNEVGQQV